MGKLSLYRLYRDQMDGGDLVEWSSATLVGGTIRLFTGKPVNHSSILLNLDHYSGLKHRRFVLEALEHGVVLNLLSMRLEDFKGKVYWSQLKPEYNDRRDRMAAWALERVGTPYDYQTLIANIFGKISSDAKKFICSELYFKDLVAAGIVPPGPDPRPGEFARYNVHRPPIRIL